jgi:hypothetical protein
VKDLGSANPLRGAARWHATDPLLSEWYYNSEMNTKSMRIYNFNTEADIGIASVPQDVRYENQFIYDPEGDRMYYFEKNTGGGNVYITYFDCTNTGGTWATVVGSPFTLTSPNGIATALIVGVCYVPTGSIPGDGDRSILVAIGGAGTHPTDVAGNNAVSYIYRLNLTDHSWSQFISTVDGITLADTWAIDTDPDANAFELIYQDAYLNDGSYPTGTSGVVFMTRSDAIRYWYYYPVVDSGINPGYSDTWFSVDYDSVDSRGAAPLLPTGPMYSNSSGRKFFYDSINNRIYFGYTSADSDRSDYIYHLQLGPLWSYGYESAVDDLFYNSQEERRRNFSMAGKNYSTDGDPYMIVMRGWDGDLYLSTPTTGAQYRSSGVYTSPIVRNVNPTYFRIYVEEEPTNTYIAASENVYADTIEVRSSDHSPKLKYDLAIGVYSIGGRDRGYLYNEGGSQGYLWDVDNAGSPEACAFTLFNNDTYYLYWTWVDAEYDTWIAIYDKNFDEVISSEYDTQASYAAAERPQKLCIDKYGGVFAYIYKNTGGNDRIRYFDNGLVMKWVETLTTNAGGSVTRNAMDLASDNETAWYIDDAADEVSRIDNKGNILVVIDSVTGPRAVVSNDVNGCFVIPYSGDVVYEFDNAGTLLRTGTIDCSAVGHAFKDFYGGFWYIDKSDNAVRRYNSSFELLVEVVGDDPDYLAADQSGCWYSSGLYDKVVHIDLNGNTDVTYSINCGPIASIGFHPDYEGSFVYPATTDSHWGTSGDIEWNEVSLQNHYLANKNYHQFRLTLRSTDGEGTPEIKSAHVVDPLKLYNIPAAGSKNAYVKTVIASGTLRTLRQPKLRTWFDVEG